MNKNITAIIFVLCLFSTCFWAACGSSSSSEEESDPAQLSIDISPDVIDTGDRAGVRIAISNWEYPVVTLKVRMPNVISYILDSSLFNNEDTVYEVDPSLSFTNGDYNYLVYYLDRFELGATQRGILSFRITADENITAGHIGVDVDFYEPESSSSSSSSSQSDSSSSTSSSSSSSVAPMFDAQDEAYIRVGPAPSSSSSSSS